jgi:hypothetical protein
MVDMAHAAGQAHHGEHDEIWVSTAHPLPRNFLSRKRYRESLRVVDER